jgi:Holliday junction resolvase RusA-like endonuclease
VHLDLPIPPSVNQLWRHGKGKYGKDNTYQTPEYEHWRHDAGWELKAQKPRAIMGWCALEIRAGIPERRRDVDNICKACGDILTEHGIIEDDAYVASLLARWDRTVPSGRIHLEVRSSIAPEMRLSSETRNTIAAGNGRRTYTTSPAEAT